MAQGRQGAEGAAPYGCVIYQSVEDGCWIAHGLHTDQIGTGDCVIDALADYIRAIDHLLAVAREEQDIAVLRDAPANVQRMAETALELPESVVQAAREKARGDWPSSIEMKVNPLRKRRFQATARQLAFA